MFVMFVQLVISCCWLSIVVDALPETVLNLYHPIPEFKEKSKGIKEELSENFDGSIKDWLHHWKPPGELNIEFFEIYSKPVTYGNYISPLDCLEPPTEIEYVSFFPLSPKFSEERYTLVMNSVDKEDYEICQAIWVNIPFKTKNSLSIDHESGKETFKFKINLRDAGDLMKYLGPRPKEDGIHKYVFFLFRQPNGWFPPHKLKFRQNWGSNHPQHHGLVSWAEYYDLKPIGFNFFISSNENLF